MTVDQHQDSTPATHKYVFAFSEGNRDMADELGGKGANLAEMTRMGMPVPPGFTISTAACRYFLEQRRPSAGTSRPDG